MAEYVIRMELISEAVFGSGQSVPGSVDNEVLHDENGLPYMKGKTIKGKLREEADALVDLMKDVCSEQYEILKKTAEDLFGSKYGKTKEKEALLKFSDCTFDDGFINYVRKGIKNLECFTPADVLEALTDNRFFIRMNEEGTTEDGSLRQVRVIRKGFKFYTRVYCHRELTRLEAELLAAGILSLRHIGALESRGKGRIRCSLLKGDKDITPECLDDFISKVVRHKS